MNKKSDELQENGFNSFLDTGVPSGGHGRQTPHPGRIDMGPSDELGAEETDALRRRVKRIRKHKALEDPAQSPDVVGLWPFFEESTTYRKTRTDPKGDYGIEEQSPWTPRWVGHKPPSSSDQRTPHTPQRKDEKEGIDPVNHDKLDEDLIYEDDKREISISPTPGELAASLKHRLSVIQVSLARLFARWAVGMVALEYLEPKLRKELIGWVEENGPDLARKYGRALIDLFSEKSTRDDPSVNLSPTIGAWDDTIQMTHPINPGAYGDEDKANPEWLGFNERRQFEKHVKDQNPDMGDDHPKRIKKRRIRDAEYMGTRPGVGEGGEIWTHPRQKRKHKGPKMGEDMKSLFMESLSEDEKEQAMDMLNRVKYVVTSLGYKHHVDTPTLYTLVDASFSQVYPNTDPLLKLILGSYSNESIMLPLASLGMEV